MSDFNVFFTKQGLIKEIRERIISRDKEDGFGQLKKGDYVFVSINNSSDDLKNNKALKDQYNNMIYLCRCIEDVKKDGKYENGADKYTVKYDEILSFRQEPAKFAAINLFDYNVSTGNHLRGRLRSTPFSELAITKDKEEVFSKIVHTKDATYFTDEKNYRKKVLLNNEKEFDSVTDDFQLCIGDDGRIKINRRPFITDPTTLQWFDGDQKEKDELLELLKKDKSIFDFYNFFNKQPDKPTKNTTQTAYTEQADKAMENSIVESVLNRILEGEGSPQVIFTGAPGTGKTFSIREWMKKNCVAFEEQGEEEKDVWKFIQFHSSYDYTDFVEGLRPVRLKKTDTTPTFVRMDGTFKAYCRDAVAHPEKKYFFVIDEINRADLGKVFGELMFGLEEDYRGEENSFDTQYKNLPTYRQERDGFEPIPDDCFAHGFYIPKNIYIVGTMNDIDRSVESLDFALRRRFEWIEVTVDNGLIDNVLRGMKLGDALRIDLRNRLMELNSTIEKDNYRKLGLSKAYHIGPAYLKDFREKEYEIKSPKYKIMLEKVWDTRIMQILINYCRGRDASLVKDFIEECHNIFCEKVYGGDNGND